MYVSSVNNETSIEKRVFFSCKRLNMCDKDRFFHRSQSVMSTELYETKKDADRDGIWPDVIANVKITHLCKVGHIDSVDQ